MVSGNRHAPVRAALVVVLCAALLTPTVASARPHTPTPPTKAAVQRAQAAAAAAAASLAQARTQVETAQARLDALDTQVEIAVEAWNAARADADTAASRLVDAETVASRARAAAASAQTDVDRLAAASYQVGADLSGGLGELAAVLDSVFRPGGIQGLADSVSQVSQVAADRRHDIVSATALRLAAAQVEARAAQASADLKSREASVAAAAAAVRATQSIQRDEVKRLVATRDAAAAVLAAARTVASTLETQRREALARAAAQARAAAAAEAARIARGHNGGRPPTDSGGTPRAWPTGSSTTSLAQRLGALAFAKAQLGDPYVAGEHGPDAYDCSGLTSAAYASVGVSMIQYSQAQFAAYEKIPVAQLQPGDLVFFATDPSDWLTIHHVGIYSGGGLMVEAPHTGDVVKYQTIWQDQLMAYGSRP